MYLRKYNIRKTTAILGLVIFSSSHIFAECSLDTVPSPPIEQYAKNIEGLIEEVKKLAPNAKCSKPAGYPGYLDVAIPANSIKQLLGSMEATSYNLGSIISDIQYYFNASGMTLPSVQKHQTTILDIQVKILSAGRNVGGYCAQKVQFHEDVTIDGSIYKTKDRTLEEVLTDMRGQTSHVLMFFRKLVTNADDRNYLDETQFPIAKKGFSDEMRAFYTSEALQKCYDEEPKNVAIKKIMKESFTAGWKYPQAVAIWKEAFQLLLYSSGVGEKDASKDAQIQAIISAQKGGVGNSRFVLNSQFFKEFKKRPNQTTQEMVKESLTRSTAETAGNDSWMMRIGQFLFSNAPRAAIDTFSKIIIAKLSIVPNTYAQNGAGTTLKYVKTAEEGTGFNTMEKRLYDEYSHRRGNVEQSKAQDPVTVVGLVQGLEELGNIRETVEENMKLACSNLDKQATNIEAARCKDFIKN